MKRLLAPILFSLGILAIILYFVFSPDRTWVSEKESLPLDTTAQNISSTKIDSFALNLILGRWVRPDGGYVLEIKTAGKDGKLEVGYFNPDPINVSRAEWVLQENKLYVMVELRDVNYPGSMYGLLYVPDQDRLQGNYFQAQENTTFEIEFVRE